MYGTKIYTIMEFYHMFSIKAHQHGILCIIIFLLLILQLRQEVSQFLGVSEHMVDTRIRIRLALMLL